MKLMHVKPLEYNSLIGNMVLLNIIRGGRNELKKTREV